MPTHEADTPDWCATKISPLTVEPMEYADVDQCHDPRGDGGLLPISGAIVVLSSFASVEGEGRSDSGLTGS